MKDIKSLNKISFFERWGYNIINSSTSTIINIAIISLFCMNVYLQFKAMNYSFNIVDILKLLTTPWIVITAILYLVYLKVMKISYFTIEGNKKFTELLDMYLYILNNRKVNSWTKTSSNFILKNI